MQLAVFHIAMNATKKNSRNSHVFACFLVRFSTAEDFFIFKWVFKLLKRHQSEVVSFHSTYQSEQNGNLLMFMLRCLELKKFSFFDDAIKVKFLFIVCVNETKVGKQK